MTHIIVDTSALIAFFIKTETHHFAAQYYVQQYPHLNWIILQTVFNEFVTWMRVRTSISKSIAVGQIIRKEHLYVNLSNEDDIATWQAFCKYDDKPWSYTDCSILIMAQKLNVSKVFAFDDHFKQMAGLGIQCVPF